MSEEGLPAGKELLMGCTLNTFTFGSVVGVCILDLVLAMVLSILDIVW